MASWLRPAKKRHFRPTGLRLCLFWRVAQRVAACLAVYTARMTNAENMKPKPGDMVVLMKVPPGMLHDLPLEDKQAISEVVGKPIVLNEYDDAGRAELEFKDRNGDFHYIYVDLEFIRAVE